MKEALVDYLAKNPLLVLFLVCAIGFPIGRIRIGGISLGTAAVLFVGVGFGALSAKIEVPTIVYEMGLAIFIYTLGLSSAQGFFTALKGKGRAEMALTVASLVIPAILLIVLTPVLHLDAVRSAGLFSGAYSNAPGLASAIQACEAAGIDVKKFDPKVPYAIAYPMSVMGPMILMILARFAFRVNLRKEADNIPSFKAAREQLENQTVHVTNPAIFGKSVAEAFGKAQSNIILGRVSRDGKTMLATGDYRFQEDDLISLIGRASILEDVSKRIGEIDSVQLHLDRNDFDYRRIFVSNQEMVAIPLSKLDLPGKHGAIITRVRRGDVEFIPTGETTLELGDRVRVVTERSNMDALTNVLGDSYKHLSEIDFLTLAFGLGLGVLIGTIPIPLPGGMMIKLGFAGGPLLVALVLGKLERTGPIVWNIPYSANLTLRQLGIILFSAGIGVKAGFSFWDKLSHGQGIDLFIYGACFSLLGGLIVLPVGYYLLKIPLNRLYGVYSGTQTQPVCLGFAVEQTQNELPYPGYATVYPAATITKIIMAQVIFAFLHH